MIREERKKIILENERVRVWEDSARVGETGIVHTHRKPYLGIVIEGEHAEAVDVEGNVLQTYRLEAGMTVFFGEAELPVTHALRNSGTMDVVIRVIELL